MAITRKQYAARRAELEDGNRGVIEQGPGVRMPWGPLTLAAALSVLFAVEAAAEPVRVDNADCGQPVHLVARDAPMSAVLARLGEALHFHVAYQTQSDPRLTVDERLDANTLVRRLVRNMNYSLEQMPDASCLRQLRIVSLAVLPDIGNKPTGIAASRAAWQTPEMERIAREGLSDYLRSHGMNDQSIEALAVH